MTTQTTTKTEVRTAPNGKEIIVHITEDGRVMNHGSLQPGLLIKISNRRAVVQGIKEDIRATIKFIGGEQFDISSRAEVEILDPEKERLADQVAASRPLAEGEHDSSKYLFEGRDYGKGPLVRAIVAAHVKKNPEITLNELKKTFPDNLMTGRYGIFQEVDTARGISGKSTRYFFKPDQLIKLEKDGVVAVCNQFTSDNIKPFLKAAKDLGYEIK